MTLKFNELPVTVQESLLWDMDLDYDSYEGSKAETIRDILCGNCTTMNSSIIENYCFALSDSDVRLKLDYAVEHTMQELENIRRVTKLLNVLTSVK